MTATPKRPRQREVYVIVILIVLGLVLGAVLGFSYTPQKGNGGDVYSSGVWLSGSYKYRSLLDISNPDVSTAIPAGYPIAVKLNYTNLVQEGNMRQNLADLRVAYYDGSSLTEIPRNPEVNFSGAYVTIYIQLQAPIAPGTDTWAYSVYYGNPDVGQAPVLDFDLTPPAGHAPVVTIASEQGAVPEGLTFPAIIIVVCIATATVYFAGRTRRA